MLLSAKLFVVSQPIVQIFPFFNIFCEGVTTDIVHSDRYIQNTIINADTKNCANDSNNSNSKLRNMKEIDG